MSTAEWFGLIIFLVVVTLLFFAAFGGSTLTDSTVEEYLERLMKEDDQNGP
jgi:Fe2+ transport system protein B